MVQFSTEKNSYLNNNDTIYEVMLTGGGVSGYLPKGNLNTQADAFGRLRISDEYTLFDSSFRYSDNERRWNTKLVGGGTVTHNANQGLMDLSVGTTSGDLVIRQTDRTFSYQPGKSLLVMQTFTFNQPKTNLRQRAGYFTKQNGVYVEVNSMTTSLNLRSSITGSVSNNSINQDDWNVDPLDGSGPSGVVLDLSKTQIFWTDIEWLGAGSVRCGFVINGQFIICHIFHHANEIVGTYMQTATLSCRLEIENTGTTASSSTLKQICTTVISEGGYQQIGLTRSVSNPLTGKTLPLDVDTPMVSIRLRSGRTDAVVQPREVTLYGIQATAFKFKIYRNCTLTGANWAIIDSASSVEYDISATARDGGRVIFESIFKGQSTVPVYDLLDQFSYSLQLTRGILDADSAGNVLTLTIQPTTNNDQAIATLTWQERTA